MRSKRKTLLELNQKCALDKFEDMRIEKIIHENIQQQIIQKEEKQYISEIFLKALKRKNVIKRLKM